VNNNKIL